MKEKLALSIVTTSSLGILFILIHVVFFGEENSPFLEGIKMFRYFTIQSNLVVAIYFSSYLKGKHKNKELFDKLLGGVVIYITITFLVFLIFLEPIYSPKGFNLIGSVFSHYVSPILVLTFMYKYSDNYMFDFKDTKLWIIFPGLYLIFLVIQGIFTDDYLYPFFQVDTVGVIGLIISIVLIVILFVLMSFSLVKIVSKKESV